MSERQTITITPVQVAALARFAEHANGNLVVQSPSRATTRLEVTYATLEGELKTEVLR